MKLKIIFFFVGASVIPIVVNLGVDRFAPGGGAWVGIMVSVVLSLVFGIIIADFLTRELKTLSEHAQKVASGDLTVQARVSGHDEIANTAASFNRMSQSLRDLAGQVRQQSDAVLESARGVSHTATEMSGSTEDIAANIQNISRGAEVQSETADRLSKLVKTFSVSLGAVADKSEETARETASSSTLAKQAIENATQAQEFISQITDGLNQNQKQVEVFRERAAEINKIVDIITTISNQTHILALNAAIEAARAGEHGRGFAVVAEEVRRLAENAKGFAEQIANLAEDIDGSSTLLKTAIEGVAQQAQAGRITVEYASKSLNEISTSVLKNVDRMGSISTLIGEQRRDAGQIERAVAEIASIASENASATEQVSAATQEQTASMEELSTAANTMTKTSGLLKELVSRFRI
jgi:methyl-accepting chemotaxis protein